MDVKKLYETDERIRKYVDSYVNTRASGRCRPPITVEEALSHKIVQEQICYYLNHENKSGVGQYTDKHDYN